MINILALAASVSCCAAATTRPSISRGSAHKTISKTIGYEYLAIVPKNYGTGSGERFPLLIFLHGSGECGNDLSLLEKHNLPKLAASREDFPFVLVAPQAPSVLAAFDVDSLDVLLDDVLSKYNVDPDRVYLTGISMGAYAVWDWAAHRADKFAAIAPISGEPNTDLDDQFVHLPVWAFHGAKDREVSPGEDEKMIALIKKRGGDAKLTLYQDAGHDAWTRTYNSGEIFEWLLQHRRWHAK